MGQQNTKSGDPPAIVATRQNRFYWEGALEGRLFCLRCARCGWYAHPPVPVCSQCHSTQMEATPMSGRGTVYAFTVVRRVFHPGFAQEVPYLLALVALAEQPALHILSRLVDCELDAASVGMAVCVTFAPHGDWQLPMFRPERNR